MESLPEFLDVQCAVGGKVDEPLFLGFKLAEFFAERFLFLLVGCLELFERAAYFASNCSEVLGVEAFRCDDTGDGCLDIIQPN